MVPSSWEGSEETGVEFEESPQIKSPGVIVCVCACVINTIHMEVYSCLWIFDL